MIALVFSFFLLHPNESRGKLPSGKATAAIRNPKLYIWIFLFLYSTMNFGIAWIFLLAGRYNIMFLYNLSLIFIVIIGGIEEFGIEQWQKEINKTGAKTDFKPDLKKNETYVGKKKGAHIIREVVRVETNQRKSNPTRRPFNL